MLKIKNLSGDLSSVQSWFDGFGVKKNVDLVRNDTFACRKPPGEIYKARLTKMQSVLNGKTTKKDQILAEDKAKH